MEELFPIALRNLKTMQAYLKQAAAFAATGSPQFIRRPVDEVVRAAIELAHPVLKQKGIVVHFTAPAALSVEMDEVLILRLLNNLLSNSANASPAGTQIQIAVRRLAETPTEREWVRLQIVDQGEGISRENLDRILSTASPGAANLPEIGPKGLGLKICQKILQLHGGKIQFFSETKKGTTVEVDLPSRRNG